MIHLNGDHLNTQTATIYEELNKKGLKTGSINGLIYRGNVEHTLFGEIRVKRLNEYIYRRTRPLN